MFNLNYILYKKGILTVMKYNFRGKQLIKLIADIIYISAISSMRIMDLASSPRLRVHRDKYILSNLLSERKPAKQNT